MWRGMEETMAQRAFYHPQLGRFTSSKDDLSALGGEYLEAAREELRRKMENPDYASVEPIMGCEWGAGVFPG